jgi:hypothetical protein
LRRIARCAFLAQDWKDKPDGAPYTDIFRRFDKDLRRELGERFDRFALLHRWNFQQPTTCSFHVEPVNTTPDKLAKEIEDKIRADTFAPEDFTAFIRAAAERNDTMKQVLAQLKEPPAKPDADTIPYLGDHAIYEQTLRVAARDLIALNVGGTWFRAESGESEDQAYARLKRSCFRTGRELEEVQLGRTDQVGSGGVSVPPVAPPGVLFPPGPTVNPPINPPVVPPIGPQPVPPVGPIPPVSVAPIIRQSNGAKSGINLLGDIERWGLPDADRLTLATLTMRGLTVKELRELCTKLPPRLLAELQITSNPETSGENAK